MHYVCMFHETWFSAFTNLFGQCGILLVIRSVSDVLRAQWLVGCVGFTLHSAIFQLYSDGTVVQFAQSRLVKFVRGEAAGRTPYTFY